MVKKVRFIHSADIHLGSGLAVAQKVPGRLGETLKNAGFAAFSRVIDAVVNHNADFLLLSGDIYDNESRSVSANQFLTAELQRLAERDIPVFIIHGNHDPLGSSVEFLSLPSNVRVFGAEDAEIAEVLGLDGNVIARVIGQSYRNVSESRKMYQAFTPPDHDYVNIGMLHTALNPDSNVYVPCALADLKSKDSIDYWALGHAHRLNVVDGQRRAVVYPGIPQGRDVGEPGAGGCLLVEIEQNRAPSLAFVPTAQVVWHTLPVPLEAGTSTVSNLDDLAEVIQLAGEKLMDWQPQLPEGVVMADGEQFLAVCHMVRWVITGRGDIHTNVISDNEAEVSQALSARLQKSLGKGSPPVWTESVKFTTASPIPDLEQLTKHDPVIKALGDLAEQMHKKSQQHGELINALGEIWYQSKDHELIKETAFPVTEHRLAQLIEQAHNLLMEKILEGREGR